MILGNSKNFSFETEYLCDEFKDVQSLLSSRAENWHYSAWHKIKIKNCGDIFIVSFRNSPFSETWVFEVTSKTKAEEIAKWLN